MPFQFVQVLWLQDDSCAAEVIALGYKHLLVLEKADEGWQVTKDYGCDDMYTGYEGDEKTGAFEIYRHAAGLAVEGLGKEDIEAAALAARKGFITAPVLFGPGAKDNKELIDRLLPIVETDSYDHDTNIERIAEYIYYGHKLSPGVPLVIFRMSAKESFYVEREQEYTPKEIAGYPPVVVVRKDGEWQYLGMSISY